MVSLVCATGIIVCYLVSLHLQILQGCNSRLLSTRTEVRLPSDRDVYSETPCKQEYILLMQVIPLSLVPVMPLPLPHRPHFSSTCIFK